ncbi:CshA/CshB family fibrillar adhesin-related protein [Actinokineospora guangxiensis]|uniref:CshA/CshB family fibrillar adhesin-related protein n=1 Tax=Actinokineospora guangxiensis TaxID=1490288 RepID=A0ABW0EN94_9PSEU
MARLACARAGVAVALTALLALVLTVVSVRPAHAEFATGGAGRFLGAIDWFSWGAHGTALPDAGFSKTQTRTVGDQTIAVTCSVSGISGNAGANNLYGYRPGSWQGDGFDDMYNVGGTGGANQLVVGLGTSNRIVTFDFSCSGTLNGTPFPLGGLVLADAEQMATQGNEFIEATIPQSATWRVIDRYRSAGCSGQTELTRSAANTLTFGRSTATCAAGPAVVGFMEGASSANVRFRGGGQTAIALGVVLSFDRGDAPASYGEAVHLEQYGFSGGTIPAGTTVLSHSPDLQLGASAQPPVRLGATVDPEDAVLAGPGATGDDTTGNGVFGPPDDEDAITDPGTIEVVAGGTYAVTAACTGTATVAGWLDWNRDGAFGAGERSGLTPCTGSAELVWTVPADVRPALDAPTYLRLRIASSAADLASASGVALSGEAEDHALRVAVPTITVTKSLPARADGDDQFTVRATRNGAEVASATTAGEQTSATSGAVAVEPGSGYRIADVAGASANLADYVPAVSCVDGITGDAVAVTGSAPEWALPALDADDQVQCTVTNTLARPAVLLTKTAGPLTDVDGNGPDAGDTVTFGFTVTNSGNVALNPVVVSDPVVGPVTCPSGPLAPGASVVCDPVARPVTQDEVNAGTLVNTATATGTAPSGKTVTSTDSTTTPIPVTRALVLDKSVGELVDGDGNGPDAGDTLEFSFQVTNTGNVPLDPVVVSDPVVGAVTCPAGPLAPGASVSCDPVTRALTQAEVDAGVLSNTATATGTAPDGGKATSTDHTSTSVVALPALSLVKSPSAVSDVDGNGPDAGDTVTYGFLVTNTGNVTLDPVTVADPKAGPVTCPAGPLAPRASVECTAAAYVLTQEDVDAAEVENTATATGTPPSGEPVTAEDSVVVPIAEQPSVRIVKMASAVQDVDGNGHDAGDTVGYWFTVINTGNQTLDPITVSDSKVGPVTCPAGPLAPGASAECTAAPYVLKQSDVDAGRVDNEATVEGLPPSLVPVVASDTATVAVVRAPLISLVKSVDSVEDVDGGGLDAGDTVAYGFTVTNAGNVTLDPVAVADPKVGPVTCPDGPLAPGASVECTAAASVLTQADVDAGEVPNTATATGTDPSGGTVSGDDSATVPIPAVRDIGLDKTSGPVVDVDGDGVDAGDEIRYGLTVTNTGNVTLDPVAVADPKLGPVTCPAGPLAPGASVECTADPYALTQADVDAGVVENTATATGTDPSGVDVTAKDSTQTAIRASGAIGLEKAVAEIVDRDGGGVDAGDAIRYRLTVTNPGAVTLHDVRVTDAKLGPVTCPAGPLAPKASVECTADPYVLTQADIDAGRVDNTAVVTGLTPADDVVVDRSTAVAELGAKARLSLDKAASLRDRDGDGKATPGETIAYTFTVRNTGAVTVSDVVINDPAVTASCPSGPLAPGESVVCTGEYVVKARDIRGGVVRNTATAGGRTPDGGTVVSPPDSTEVPAVVPEPPVPPRPKPPKPDPDVPPLPDTGASVGVGLGIGAGLVLMGMWALLLSRRRG